MSIAVLGGYGVGLTMRVPRAPRSGETVTGGVLSREHGGKGSNQAVAIARWGGRSALITAVGADADGEAARELWRAEAVDDRAVVTVPHAATMAGVILVDDAGENRIAIAPGALEHLTLDQGGRRAIQEADLLVISLETPVEVAHAAIAAAREHDVRVLLNPAPATALPSSLWQSVDILVPNQSEARTLLDDDSIDDVQAARALAEIARCVVVLTRGADGALIAEPGREPRTVSAPAVTAVDTTGAGDAFVGVLAAELAAGVELMPACERACAAAATSVEHPGVIAGLPRNPAAAAGRRS